MGGGVHEKRLTPYNHSWMCVLNNLPENGLSGVQVMCVCEAERFLISIMTEKNIHIKL